MRPAPIADTNRDFALLLGAAQQEQDRQIAADEREHQADDCRQQGGCTGAIARSNEGWMRTVRAGNTSMPRTLIETGEARGQFDDKPSIAARA